MRKNIILLLIIIVIIGVVVMWQYWSKSAEENQQELIGETINWEIYTNNEHGFTIQYPVAQGVKPFTPDGSYKTPTIVELRPQYAWEPKGVDGGWEPARLEIAYQEYQQELSLEEYVLDLWNNVLNFSAYNNGQILTKDLLKAVTIGGLNGYELKVSTESYSYVLHNKKIYSFYILADEKFKKISNQMLSTFLFLQDQIDIQQVSTISEEKHTNDPQWLIYSDSDISFRYPKTLCDTSWQEEWDTYSCDGSWEVKRIQSDYAGNKQDLMDGYIQIMPSYSSFGFEFGGDIQIIFISKDEFDENILGKSLQQQTTKQGYQTYVEENIEGYPDKIDNYYLTNKSKYIIVRNNFPDRYPTYFSFLLDSIEL